MPSNKDLIAAIKHAAIEIGVSTPLVSGVGNNGLVEILKDLTEPVGPPTPPVLPEVVNIPPVKPPTGYVIAPGKCITCKKGVLDEGKEIKVEWVSGGQESFDKLTENGYVVKG